MSVFEKASADLLAKIKSASSFDDLATYFKAAFGIGETITPEKRDPDKDANAYKDGDSDYGVQVRGKKARERVNEMAREILAQVDDPEDLTPEQRDILKQYSGRGGLTENSQYEYYTPEHVAEGVWGAMQVNGFANGNVLEPSCGHGIFLSTKPAGTIVSGNDLDPTGSKVARLLHPADHVSNAPFEQIVMQTPDDTFDGCVGNVPFGGARGKFMHDDPAFKDEKRIECYFIHRIIDKTKPGGLICLVVPTGVVGNKGVKWSRFRADISKKAEFLGAHKLPSKTFGNQGTDTVVDVIVLKKHPRDLLDKVDDLPLDTLKASNVLWGEFIQGMYWQGEGRPFIMGKYVPKVEGDRWSREVVDGDVDNAGLKAKLAQRFESRIDWPALEVAPLVPKTYAEGDRKSVGGQQYAFVAGSWQKLIEVQAKTPIAKDRYGAESVDELKGLLDDLPGCLSISMDQALRVYKDYPDAMSPIQRKVVEFALSQPGDEKCQEQIWRGSIIGNMIGRAMSKSDAGEDCTADLDALRDLVAGEVAKYGHPKNNKKLVLTGDGVQGFGLFLNAMDKDGNFSDLLQGKKLDKAQADSTSYDEGDIQDIVRHLFVREGNESIEIEDVKALYTGKIVIETLADVAEIEGVAISPDGHIYPVNAYCAGEITGKLADLSAAIAQEDDPRLVAKFQAQIDEINRKRTITKPEDIAFSLQHKWFSKRYVVEFLRDYGYVKASYGRIATVEEEDYSGNMVKKEQFVEDFEAQDGIFIGIPEVKFDKQFLKYLGGGKVTSNDQDTIEKYREQVATMEAQFNAFMQQHQDIEDVAAEYNARFNNFIPQQYDDMPLEGMEGYLSGRINPHTYQCSEVRRLSDMGSGICGFNTGLGKSFMGLSLAAYNHSKGRSKRACIVVPSATLENWYHEARAIYSDAHMAKIHFIGLRPKRNKKGNVQNRPILGKDGNPRTWGNGSEMLQDVVEFRNSKEQVYEDMWAIPQSNYALVVMTKEKFGMIPVRPETKSAYVDKMVGKALMSERVAASMMKDDEKAAGKKKTYKDDVKQATLEGKFGDDGTKKSDALPYLEDMGFDSVLTDETHFYKNSMEAGDQTQGIAYLPTAPSAKIARDMALKSDYIREMNNGRGVYGLSATPVTNSPFEIFNILTLVCPLEEFERFGVYSVDDFVRVFGQIENVDKMTISGEVKSVQGLTGFQNLDGLRNLFHKYVNLKKMKDVGAVVHEPMAVEKDELVAMSEGQENVYEVLRSRAKEAAKKAAGGGGKSAGEIFSIIRDMDRVTTDLDLYYHTMTFIFPIESAPQVDKIVSSLPISLEREFLDEDTGDKKKTFIDANITLENLEYAIKLVVPEEFEDQVVMQFTGLGIDASRVSHPLTPKYAKLMENLKSHFESNGRQIVFTEEKSQHQKIKRIIVNHLPVTEDQIAIINAEDASGDKLDKISKAYNAGTYRIVIANKKAEVGVNLQQGTSAIHHLTLPWTPASINQRNGRGVRQGNERETVDVFYYCGKGSFDLYRKDLLKAKAGWIDELFTGEGSTARNGDATSGEDFMDLLADDPEEAARIRKERLAKEQAKRAERDRANMVNKLMALAANHAALLQMDTEREARREKLKSDLVDVHSKLARLKNNEAEQEKQDKAQAEINALQARLDGLDAVYDDKKAKVSSRVKIAANFLRQQSKDGKLPFDAALIDNPQNAIADTYGTLYAVGDVLEHDDNIIKITGVDVVARTVIGEALVGYVSYEWKRGIELKKLQGWKKVSYSERELSMKVLLSESHYYYELPTLGIDAATFKELGEGARIQAPIVYVAEGETRVKWEDYSGYDPQHAEIVWPEPTQETFRAAVCKAYLEVRRESTYFGTNAKKFMETLFGANYADVALEYGTKATESDVRAWVVNEYEKLKLTMAVTTATEESNRYYRAEADIVARAQALGDNKDEIKNVSRAAMTEIKAALDARVREEREEEQRVRAAQRAQEEAEKAARDAEELAKMKADPAYKEVSAEWVDKFSSIGITIKYNTKPVAFRGMKGTSNTFGRLFLNDKAGKNGHIYRVKEILKNRYGSTFTDSWDEHYGAWWHFDASKATLENLYDLLS